MQRFSRHGVDAKFHELSSLSKVIIVGIMYSFGFNTFDIFLILNKFFMPLGAL